MDAAHNRAKHHRLSAQSCNSSADSAVAHPPPPRTPRSCRRPKNGHATEETAREKSRNYTYGKRAEDQTHRSKRKVPRHDRRDHVSEKHDSIRQAPPPSTQRPPAWRQGTPPIDMLTQGPLQQMLLGFSWPSVCPCHSSSNRNQHVSPAESERRSTPSAVISSHPDARLVTWHGNGSLKSHVPLRSACTETKPPSIST